MFPKKKKKVNLDPVLSLKAFHSLSHIWSYLCICFIVCRDLTVSGELEDLDSQTVSILQEILNANFSTFYLLFPLVIFAGIKKVGKKPFS